MIPRGMRLYQRELEQRFELRCFLFQREQFCHELERQQRFPPRNAKFRQKLMPHVTHPSALYFGLHLPPHRGKHIQAGASSTQARITRRRSGKESVCRLLIITYSTTSSHLRIYTGRFRTLSRTAERSAQTRLRSAFMRKRTLLIFMTRSHLVHGGHRHIIVFSAVQR